MTLKVQDISIKTNDKNNSLLEVAQPRNYTPSQDEAEKVAFVMKRFNDMDSKRQLIANDWELDQQQYEAIWKPYSDWRSSSNVPLERSIIELFVAEAIKRPTKFRISGEYWYDFQGKIFDKVWKRDWKVNDRNNTILDNEYITALFWTSILYSWFELKHRIIEDFDWISDDWKIEFIRKLETKGNIILDNVDIRHFWIDEKAHKIDEAVDCIVEEYITQEEFNTYKHNKFYKNTDTEIASYFFHDNKYTFITEEERWDWESKYIKLTHYWNEDLDKYMVIANNRVIIREHPIMNASHKIPFTVRQYWKNLFSIYGYWLARALRTFKSDINNLREMLMDAIKRSNSQTIAIGNWLVFDWNTFAYDNQIMQFKGNLAWNFQQISWNAPNQAIFSYLQQLYKDVAIYCWLDIQNILWEPQQTAYQTAVQKESSLQRVNVVFANRDQAFSRLANLHKDNLQMFFPMKMVRELVKINKEDEVIEEKEATYPTIELEREQVKWKRVIKSSKNNIFEVKPETIRWSIKLDVYTDLNAPTINEVEKAQKMEFFWTVANITWAYAQNPVLEQILPMKKTIKDMAEMFNIDTEMSDADWVEEAKQKLMNELLNMQKWVWWGWLQAMTWWQTEQPTTWWNEAMGQQAPTTTQQTIEIAAKPAENLNPYK